MRWLAVAAVVATFGGCGGCGKKKPSAEELPPEVTGLATVPANAEVVVAVDVDHVVDSQVVERAVDQLLMRDPDLAGRWQKLHDSCKIDLTKQVKRVMVALGPSDPKSPGTGPMLMVAIGNLAETELEKCVQAMVGQGGGSLTAKAAGDRTLYQAKDGNRTLFFAFGRPDTVVLGSSEAYVLEALGPGKKVLDNPELASWIKQVDQRSPIWAAGRVAERVRQGLVKATNSALTAGPVAFVATFDPTDGATLDLGVIMADAKDANTLETFAKDQLGLFAMAAQAKNLGGVVEKVSIEASDQVVRFKAKLAISDINRLFCLLDGNAKCSQDATP
ncbi:MAG TPA: hypothetical protein VGO00_19975 [Kofleriaceae bacterium]|nr:hypothetical protein [Kofleriaceae bacterium]